MTEFSSLIGQNYAFASGRIGVLQQLLLTGSDRDRLLGAKDLAEAEQILTELKLTSGIDQGLRKADEVLLAVSEWIAGEVEQMSPKASKPTFTILLLEDDAALISFLLKQEKGLTMEDAVEPVLGHSAYNPELLRSLILEKDYRLELPTHLVDFVREIQKDSRDWSPEEIDAEVANFTANLAQKLARASGSSLIAQYVSNSIDVQNIRTALRLNATEESALLPGGTIDVSKAIGDNSALASLVEKSDLPNSIAAAMRESSANVNAIEAALSEVAAADIARMWNVPLSIEPVFAFAAIGASQLRLLRALIIGKRAGLSPQQIKEMLPPFLSASHYVLS